ncbi:MAG: fructose PTS transporter subunit IIA [Vallitaleaceae bacterium]|jgi:fructose-specific phosphotransferase system IIA component|nr:fructose PTS transporter subunit IIA [Vallitaleaceae bacterium]
MTLQQIMASENIILDMEVTDKNQALNKLATALDKSGRLHSLKGFMVDVKKRESIESTNMEMGVAIPHSKCEAIAVSSVAMARLKEPIDWEDGGSLVKYVFLLAVSPEDDGITHLEVISKIAELLIEESFLSLLSTAIDGMTIITYIQNYMAQ